MPTKQKSILTVYDLLAEDACEEQVIGFQRLFGDSAEVTEKNWHRAIRAKLDVTFLVLLLSPEARAEYKKVCAGAWAEYDKVCAAAWAEYDKVRAAAWAEYEKVRVAALAEYDKVRAAARAEYDKVRAAARAEYDKVIAPARAEYDKVCAAALAEYDKVRAAALFPVVCDAMMLSHPSTPNN